MYTKKFMYTVMYPHTKYSFYLIIDIVSLSNFWYTLAGTVR